MKEDLIKIYSSSKTVFTTNELSILWNHTKLNDIKAKLYYFVKKGYLIRLRRGIFAKSKTYDPKELAAAIYRPAYISFETVLRDSGVIFQHYDTIFVASYLSRYIRCHNITIQYRKLQDAILYNHDGLEERNNYCIATSERALLDLLYVAPRSYYDNLRAINWNQCFKLVKLYQNKELTKRLEKLYKNFKD